MIVFYDARCPECQAAVGWAGRYSDRPPCGECGHRLTPKQLAEGDASMERLASRRLDPEGERLRKWRIRAGLTLRAAAVALGVSPTALSLVECGEDRPAEALLANMRTVYGEERRLALAIERNVEDRKAAQSLLDSMLAVIREDYQGLPSDRARLLFREMVVEKFRPKKKGVSVPAAPPKRIEPARKVPSDRVREALTLCDQIELVAGDVPSAGEHFADDVVASMEEVRETIENSGFVTDRQMESLENWYSGLCRWIH